jgi:uncharacterized Zn finger protein (UPF0148 family)
LNDKKIARVVQKRFFGKGIVIMEAYCVKCKAKKEMTDPKEETMKNGRKMLKGKCPQCGTVMCRILGKDK